MEDRNREEEKKAKREQRKKRRTQERISAFTVLIVLVLVLVAGITVGAISLKNHFAKEREVSSEVASEEISEEPIVLTEPDSIEISAVEEELIPEEVTSEPHPMDGQIDSLLASMTTEQKVAALFITSPEALTGVNQAVKAGSGTKTALEQYQIGGLVYSSRNVQSKNQFSDMIAKTKEMSKTPLFLAVTEEGGKENTVAGKMGIKAIESAEVLGAGEDGGLTSESYKLMGTYLAEFGINLNFAPRADLLTNAEATDKVKMFGSDSANVSKMVAEAITSLNDSKVSACMKFFPGEGEVSGVSNLTIRTLDEMRSAEFLSFQSGIDAGADMIMVSDISAPAVNGSDVPSCLSEVMVNTVLRDELGFEGIIITSDLANAAVTDKLTSKEAAVQAIQAGNDMILITKDFKEAYDAVVAAVSSNTITEEQLDLAVRRIYRVKLSNSTP